MQGKDGVKAKLGVALPTAHHQNGESNLANLIKMNFDLLAELKKYIIESMQIISRIQFPTKPG